MRRSRAQWVEIVEEFERSGLSHAAFCARERLNVGSFHGWLYRLRQGLERGKVARSATRLLPVRVSAPDTVGDEEVVELSVAGVVVRVRSSVDPVYVAELVGRLRDLRRGHDGLFAIVRNQWRLDAFAGHLFVFVGRRGNRIKILFWDSGGFVIYYKRLEHGRFRLPRLREGATSVTLDATQLGMLLDGIDVDQVRRAKHWTPPAPSVGVAHG